LQPKEPWISKEDRPEWPNLVLRQATDRDNNITTARDSQLQTTDSRQSHTTTATQKQATDRTTVFSNIGN
jgi:hypothetical protein